MYFELYAAGAALRPEKDINTIDDVEAHAERVIGARAQKLFAGDVGDWLVAKGITSCILAGGALFRAPIADLDLFPVSGRDKAFLKTLHELRPDNEDAQYAEVEVGGTKLQLCQESCSDLEELIESFDFAHCQVGVVLEYVEAADGNRVWKATEVYASSAWVAAMLIQGTFYVEGAKWPLRSLARVPKVAAKLGLSASETQALAWQVTASIANRGFDSVVADDPKFASAVGLKPAVTKPKEEVAAATMNSVTSALAEIDGIGGLE